MARFKVGQRVDVDWELVNARRIQGKDVPYDLWWHEAPGWARKDMSHRAWHIEILNVSLKSNGGAKYVIGRFHKDRFGRVVRHTVCREVAPMFLKAHKVLEESDYQEMI